MFITMCGTEVATLGGLEDPPVCRTPPTLEPLTPYLLRDTADLSRPCT